MNFIGDFVYEQLTQADQALTSHTNMATAPRIFQRAANGHCAPEAAHARSGPRGGQSQPFAPDTAQLRLRRRVGGGGRGRRCRHRGSEPLSPGYRPRRFAPQQRYRAEVACGGFSPPRPSPGLCRPIASRRCSPEAGPCPHPRRGMKRIFGFGWKKKGQRPSGSASLPCPAGAYEIRQKDLGKLHRAAASGDLAQVRQGLKKCSIDERDKAER